MRGVCRWCELDWALTRDGVLRSHLAAGATVCPGSHQRPATTEENHDHR